MASALNSSFDLVVVGAGIVGLAHALAAVRRGLKVAVVDREARAGLAGVTNWARAYSSTRGGVVRCDFSAMLSPETRAELVVPPAAAQRSPAVPAEPDPTRPTPFDTDAT